MPLALPERLAELICARGPVPFRDWMEAALYDPAGGYYNRQDLKRWGREGDYRTSPERSELFAATLARYFATLYDELQRPSRWTIVEGGGGDGRFAAGLLSALAEKFPVVFEATQFFIHEISPDALSRAQEALRDFTFEVVADVPLLNPGIYFSNELLDAFPVHRLVNVDGELAEFYVTTTPEGGFAWTTGPLSTPRLIESCRSLELASGQIIEVNLALDDWLAAVAAKLQRGYVITVDYGAEARELYDYSQRPHGTLRAFSRHGFVEDLLAQPGDYDITSTINWTQVKTVGERHGLQVVEFVSQDKFLLKAGLLDELELRLNRAATDAEKFAVSTGAREMILPGGMASSFQVLVQKRGGDDGERF